MLCALFQELSPPSRRSRYSESPNGQPYKGKRLSFDLKTAREMLRQAPRRLSVYSGEGGAGSISAPICGVWVEIYNREYEATWFMKEVEGSDGQAEYECLWERPSEMGAPPPVLPPWHEAKDDGEGGSGETFFYNEENGESTWER